MQKENIEQGMMTFTKFNLLKKQFKVFKQQRHYYSEEERFKILSSFKHSINSLLEKPIKQISVPCGIY